MKKLGTTNYHLISRGVNITGTFDPEECFYVFEESLLVCDAQEVYNFLKWVHENKKTFGHGNYEKVFAEYKKSN